MKNNLLKLLVFGSFTFLLGQNTPSINGSLKTAKMLERKGDIDGAIAIYADIIQKIPNHQRAVKDLKSLYKNNKRYNEGIQFLKEQLVLFPNDIQTYSQLGEFYYLNDKLSHAKSIWKTSTEIFQDNRSYYRIMISLFNRYSLDQELLSLMETGRNKFGKSFMAYEAGVYYQSRRVYDKSLDQFILHLTNKPRQNVIIHRRILQMSDEEDAIDIIEKKLIAASKENPKLILNLLSEFYFKQQYYEKAYQVKAELSKLGNIDSNDWLKFANDLRSEMQYDLSIKSYNFIMSQNLNSKYIGKALLGLAQTFEDQIVPINESYLIPYFFDNNIFFEDPFQVYSKISPNHLESCLALYDSLLVSLPTSPLLAEAYFRLGEIQFKILQDFDQAYKLLNKAIQSKPDKKLKLKILLRTADIHLAKGESQKALDFLQRQLEQNPLPAIEQKKILIHFLADEPDSTLKIVQKSFFAMSPVDPSFNDLMELKNIITQYIENDPTSILSFKHFLRAEWYLRQRKIGDAIKELEFLVTNDSTATIVPIAILRQSLLHYRLKEYDQAISLALSLNDTHMADRGIILAGQIYETKFLDSDKAMAHYMRILDEFPNSIFVEPIRFHIRSMQKTES
tara:strand:+ start:7572 stop:9434 length:1863 start_codon:yes stop_codon:yes gene_type:complete